MRKKRIKNEIIIELQIEKLWMIVDVKIETDKIFKRLRKENLPTGDTDAD